MSYDFLDIQDLVNKRSMQMCLTEGSMSKADIRDRLSVPDMRPNVLDRTWEFWLGRIRLWGKVKVKHFDPETNKRQEISGEKMIDRLTDDSLLKTFGEFDVIEHDFNKIELRRNYTDSKGKKVREWFIVEVELVPELKKAVSSWLL